MAKGTMGNMLGGSDMDKHLQELLTEHWGDHPPDYDAAIFLNNVSAPLSGRASDVLRWRTWLDFFLCFMQVKMAKDKVCATDKPHTVQVPYRSTADAPPGPLQLTPIMVHTAAAHLADLISTWAKKDATWSSIADGASHVLLVGGPSALPQVQSLPASLFGDTVSILSCDDCTTAVAKGCLVYSQQLLLGANRKVMVDSWCPSSIQLQLHDPKKNEDFWEPVCGPMFKFNECYALQGFHTITANTNITLRYVHGPDPHVYDTLETETVALAEGTSFDFTISANPAGSIECTLLFDNGTNKVLTVKPTGQHSGRTTKRSAAAAAAPATTGTAAGPQSSQGAAAGSSKADEIMGQVRHLASQLVTRTPPLPVENQPAPDEFFESLTVVVNLVRQGELDEAARLLQSTRESFDKLPIQTIGVVKDFLQTYPNSLLLPVCAAAVNKATTLKVDQGWLLRLFKELFPIPSNGKSHHHSLSAVS